jgi:glucose-1-phosphate cytidylyltransferase
MKVVILAGGAGTRLSEETEAKPKPMVEVGGKPILWHIMKIYSQHGFNDFIICLGYKGFVIKEYFHHYDLHLTDVTIDLRTNKVKKYESKAEPWKVTLVDTGIHTGTAGRIRRVQRYIGNRRFLLTYGDGVADVDLRAVLRTHQGKKKAVTVTAVQSTGRFGVLSLDKQDRVLRFREKPAGDTLWVNGGFFVCEPEVFDYLGSDESVMWEREPLTRLAEKNRVAAYKHRGFWKPMDTLRDKHELEALWIKGRAPWKIWK